MVYASIPVIQNRGTVWVLLRGARQT
jgi:hypothetical protein